jgi:PAS domain-containing protein
MNAPNEHPAEEIVRLQRRVSDLTAALTAANREWEQERTDRKRAENAFRASEHNLKLIIDTIPALAWSARPDGSAEFFNQHYLDFIGFSAEQAKDWGWTAAVHPDMTDLAPRLRFPSPAVLKARTRHPSVRLAKTNQLRMNASRSALT